jgi:predicted lysophospholipase L1 biosynthesis ABC-type transport system permease subunit
VNTSSLTSIEHTIYQPLSGRGFPQVLISDTASGREAVRKAIAEIEPALRVKSGALSANLEPRLRGSRTAAWLAGAVGALALTLAAIGMFAVFACWVQQRTHEIGVRMALGARSKQIVSLLLQSSIISIGVGAIVGLASAAAASRVLQSYMFGLTTADPVAYGIVIVVVTAAGALATWWPAQRATHVDPVHALRYE